MSRRKHNAGGKGELVKAKNRDARRHYIEARKQSDDSAFRYEPERFIVGQPEKPASAVDKTSPDTVSAAGVSLETASRTPANTDSPAVHGEPIRYTRERASANESSMIEPNTGQRQSPLQFEPPKKAPALKHKKRKQPQYAVNLEDKEKQASSDGIQGIEDGATNTAPDATPLKPDVTDNYRHVKGSKVKHSRESALDHRKPKHDDSDSGDIAEVKGDAFGVSSPPRSVVQEDNAQEDAPQPSDSNIHGERQNSLEQRKKSGKLRFSPKEQPSVMPDAKSGEAVPLIVPVGKGDESRKNKADSGASPPSDKTGSHDNAKSGVDKETRKTGVHKETEQNNEKPGKLHFSEDDSVPIEPKNRKLDKAEKKFERTSKKLDKARDDLPSKKRLRTQQVFNVETGKTKRSLVFEKEPISQKEHLKGPVILRPVKSGANALIVSAHGKIHQVERDNVGVEAGHKGEIFIEGSMRKAYRQHKTEPYRTVSKLEHDMVKKSADLSYQQAVAKNPQLQGNAVQKAMQKHKIKRDYAKKAREAQKTAQRAKKAAEKTAEATKKTAGVIRRHPIATLVVLIILLLLLCVLSMCSQGGMFSMGGLTSLAASTYLADDADMYAAEAAYSGMESDLQYELDNYASLHPGYDEYNFDLDSIWHDPYVLTSILSALHEGEWTIADVQGTLALLFDMQYTLTQTVTVEVRYYTEYWSYTDPETGETDSGSYEVPYNYYICDVTLKNFNLSHLPIYIMGEEQLSRYALYMATLGNRPDLFPVGMYPHASTIKMPTLYDIPPEYLEDETFAAIINEAKKYIGMPYVWGGYNPNTSFDCSGFVSWVINHSGWNVGRLGAQGLYNICTPVSPASARPGDLIFFVGTYDTPGVSHVGIYVGDNMMLHCGDPIGYASIDTAYWQSHFYAFGHLPGY